MKKNEILKIYGTEYLEMTKKLLEEAALKEQLSPDMRIGIKPNLVSPSPACFGSTTHPEIVAGIIEYLKENGFDDICIMEGCWVGDKTAEAFDYCGYYSLAEKYGIRLVDTQLEKSFETDTELKIKVCDCVRQVDFLINVPVLKGHCQTNVTCSLKNLKGLIPNSEKRRFHSMGLHLPIAILNTVIRQDFIVVDNICGDPDNEGGGNPFYRNCIMAGKDPVLMDVHACGLLGYSKDEVEYIGLAAKAGVGCDDISRAQILTVGGTEPEGSVLPVTHRILKLKELTKDVDTCSACYESLIDALSRLEADGLLKDFPYEICIGQGYRGENGDYGVGNCTCRFKNTVPGCPPKSEDIYKTIQGWVLPKEKNAVKL